jgi:hypothetical protein
MTWIASAIALVMVGCSETLTYERWQTIYEGQPQDGVEATLGKPTERLESRWLYIDDDCHVTAEIYFQECRVIGKTWSDPEHGPQGKSPFVNQPGDADTLKYRKTE